MIYVLHGQDTAASYQRLLAITSSSASEVIKLSSNNTQEDLYSEIFTKDMFADNKTIVCENYFKDKKIKADLLGKIPADCPLIFWEQSQLPVATLVKIKKTANIEHFKLKSRVYAFCDALSPSVARSLNIMNQLADFETQNLLWIFTERILLLLFAKMGIDKNLAGKFMNRAIEDWQWQIIVRQAKVFNTASLNSLFGGAIKIDQMIKTGKTNMQAKTLISLLLLKYSVN